MADAVPADDGLPADDAVPGDLVIAVDDPAAPDVRALLEDHLAFSYAVTPAENVFALDVDALRSAEVTFFSARAGGELLGVGALKRLDPTHAELKSMHTRAPARRRGLGRAMVRHLLAVARAEGYHRVSLETGTMEAYAPARALYRSMGFRPCGPFGDYRPSPDNTWMTMVLTGEVSERPGRPPRPAGPG